MFQFNFASFSGILFFEKQNNGAILVKPVIQKEMQYLDSATTRVPENDLSWMATAINTIKRNMPQEEFVLSGTPYKTIIPELRKLAM